VSPPSPEHPDAIIARIAERRKRAGESHLETLPDDPAGVIAWVIAHPDAPCAVLREDVLDCLTLSYWLRVTVDRRELALLKLGRRRSVGITWLQAAGALHLNSAQGAQQRMLRLQAQRDSTVRNEKAVRAKWTAEARQEMWLEENEPRIRDASEAMVKAAPDGAPELAEELEEGTVRTIMVWLRGATRDYPPGLCPAAETLAAEWDALGG
jgi:hypothetical protein